MNSQLPRRRVCVVLTTRGNYGKMASTLTAARRYPSLEMQVVLGGPVARKGQSDFLPVIEAAGHRVDRAIDYLVDDASSLEGLTQSAARAVEAFGEAFAELRSDVIVIVGDRYEALSAAFAATCRNVAIAHVEGGESSGSIDERLRHAISKLSQIHFPANAEAAARLKMLGENPDRIVVVGSPSLDVLSEHDLSDRAALFNFQKAHGAGEEIDFHKPYLVVSQHPVVYEHGGAADQIAETAAAVAEFGMPIVWVLPNRDAGSAAIDAAVANARKNLRRAPLRIFEALPISIYLRLLHHASCLVGNSSSGIRECAFLGVPVVNIGSRQSDRLRGPNVADVGYGRAEIGAAIRRQLDHGRYQANTLYGDGRAGEKITHALTTMPLDLHKPFIDVPPAMAIA